MRCVTVICESMRSGTEYPDQPICHLPFSCHFSFATRVTVDCIDNQIMQKYCIVSSFKLLKIKRILIKLEQSAALT